MYIIHELYMYSCRGQLAGILSAVLITILSCLWTQKMGVLREGQAGMYMYMHMCYDDYNGLCTCTVGTVYCTCTMYVHVLYTRYVHMYMYNVYCNT